MPTRGGWRELKRGLSQIRPRGGRGTGSGAVQGLARRAGGGLKCPGRGWAERSVDPRATLARVIQATEREALRDSLAA